MNSLILIGVMVLVVSAVVWFINRNRLIQKKQADGSGMDGLVVKKMVQAVHNDTAWGRKALSDAINEE